MLARQLVPHLADLRLGRQEYEAARKASHTVRAFSRWGRARAAWALARIWLRPRRRVLFHPAHPSRHSIFYKACALLGYATTNDRDVSCDVAIHYRGDTWSDSLQLGEAGRHVPILNQHCTDISKTTVAAAFQSVFGIGLAVDPTTFAGTIVEKSDENYTHDGRVLHGPVPAALVRPGAVYQREVDNRDGDDGVVDLRVPILGARIPLVYRKRRPIADRFSNQNSSVRLLAVEEAFDSREVALLLALAEEMHLHCGEMDVLRDNGSGQIYVVDVNKTPAGPPNGLAPADARTALERVCAAFEAMIESAIEEGERPRRG